GGRSPSPIRMWSDSSEIRKTDASRRRGGGAPGLPDARRRGHEVALLSRHWELSCPRLVNRRTYPRRKATANAEPGAAARRSASSAGPVSGRVTSTFGGDP